MAKRSEKKREHKRNRLRDLAERGDPKAAAIVRQILDNAAMSMRREVNNLQSRKSAFVVVEEALRQLPGEAKKGNRLEVDLLNCALATIARAADPRLNRLSTWPRLEPPKR
jgi:histidine ammonia-lyase